MKEVKSSTISHLDHKDGVLSVKFKSSPTTVYDYPGVSAIEFNALFHADSIGSHFHKYLKGREFTKREG